MRVRSLDNVLEWWDNPTMTVIADNKHRVTLPTKPGERFDVKDFAGEKFGIAKQVLIVCLAPVPRHIC